MEDLMTTDACTMPTSERPLRLAEFDQLFAENVRRVERRPDGVTLHLSGTRGLRRKVEELTNRESECCTFFSFSVAGNDERLTLGISVPPMRREILDGVAARAMELSA
jgi:hypothetical protein